MGGQKPHLLVRRAQQPGRRDPRRLRAVDDVLPAGQARPDGRGSPGCRSRCTWSSGSRPTTASAATGSSPATPTTTATSTAWSASSAASAWSSSGTPRSSRRSPPAASCRPATTSTRRRTCRRCSHEDVVPHRRLSRRATTSRDFFAGLLDGDDAGEYYREPGLTDDEAASAAARRHRAARRPDRRRGARGLPRAQGLDAAPGGLRARRHRPKSGRTRTTVTEQNFTVRALQPRGAQPPRRVLHPCPRGDHLPLRAQSRRSARSSTRSRSRSMPSATCSSRPRSATDGAPAYASRRTGSTIAAPNAGACRPRSGRPRPSDAHAHHVCGASRHQCDADTADDYAHLSPRVRRISSDRLHAGRPLFALPRRLCRARPARCGTPPSRASMRSFSTSHRRRRTPATTHRCSSAPHYRRDDLHGTAWPTDSLSPRAFRRELQARPHDGALASVFQRRRAAPTTTSSRARQPCWEGRTPAATSISTGTATGGSRPGRLSSHAGEQPTAPAQELATRRPHFF